MLNKEHCSCANPATTCYHSTGRMIRVFKGCYLSGLMREDSDLCRNKTVFCHVTSCAANSICVMDFTAAAFETKKANINLSNI